MRRSLELVANLFPLWVLVACGLALAEPGWFAWFRGPAIVAALAVIMLGMGITLSVDDFTRVATRPLAVVTGVVAQFLIMPAAGWSVATLLDLETPLAVGLILVACCPGGTASNVVTYIARADVALSVVMTACSTMAAVVLTPLLTKLLAGQLVEVDALGLVASTLQVVVLPVAVGVAVNRFVPKVAVAVQPLAPVVSVLAIALVCASVIAQNAAAVWTSGPRLLAAVVALHGIGFGVGYMFARAFGYDLPISRTISIEVGMQNSGLGVVLAQRHFPAEPLTAVPCAISSVVHSLIGSGLACWWRLGR
ncbi:MAG: bile acid:sodium symporter family protein [Planctomycetia bacterium]|nr:bile acid:sodium symporter family protein [Planctomycetia bacterium]